MTRMLKKRIILFGAVCIAILMISSVTAVAQVQSTSASKIEKQTEQRKTSLNAQIKILSKHLLDKKNINMDSLKDKIKNILSKLNTTRQQKYDSAKPCLIPLLPIVIALLPVIIELILTYPQSIAIFIALLPIGLPLPVIFRLAKQLRSDTTIQRTILES